MVCLSRTLLATLEHAAARWWSPGTSPSCFTPASGSRTSRPRAIAAEHHGVALNLIVDNDLAQVGVDSRSEGRGTAWSARPRSTSTAGAARLPTRICASRTKTSSRHSPAASRSSWAMPCRSGARRFLAQALARRGETRSLGERFSLARREVEASWGVSNLEVPLSSVCQTDGFSWFVCHLLAQLPAYVQIHNQALAEYRLAHGIRSKNHPVAALAEQGDWLEAPFWVWRRASPRRRGLLARLRGREIDLRIAGENELLVELPLGPDREACCAVERLRDLAGQSVRLRTRALTTTLFSRFLLGDLFIHGIGGSKYDELGDEIARRFLGIEPPAFLTVSLTQWLGLPDDPTAPDPSDLVRRIALAPP